MAMTGGTAKLVASGTPSGWPGPISIYVYYKEKSQSVTNNTTTLSLGMYITTPSGWYFGPWVDYGGSYVGTATSGSNCKSFDGSCPANTEKLIWVAENLDVTVTHGSDGTKTATIYWKYGVNSTWAGILAPSGSFTVKLTTIPRKSSFSLSATSVQMKNNVTITIDRKSTSFTHTLEYSFGGSTGTIATDVGASYKWTVPDLVSKISGQTSGTCTITCKTYSGATLVGSTTGTLTLTIPGKSAPTASASSVQMGKSVTISTNRASTGFTHTLTYAIGSTSGTIGTGVTTSKAWTPPKSLASYTGNKTSATCTITCETYTGSKLVGTATTTVTLTVPNATVPTLSASTVALGSNITISMPKEADVYTHDLTYSLKADGSSTVAASGTITTGVSSEHSWPVPLTLAAKIPSATKGTITVTCKTRFKDSTTEVGTETAFFTVTVPDNSTTKPKVTVTLTPVSDLPSAFSNVYVAGKSKVKVSYAASSDYSTIASYHTSVNGGSGSANPYTSSLLANSGTVTITGKVTDARGYSTDVTFSIEVAPYSRPRIIPESGQSNIVCLRCNSDGTVDPGGVHLLIKIGRKYEKVVSGGSQKNYCQLSYCYKTDAQSESEYSSPATLLSRTATSDYVSKVISGVVSSNTTAYNIQLTAEDDLGEKDTVTITVPTAFVTFHSPAGGHGFTLGGYHDPDKYDVFDCRFDAEFQGNVTGKVLGLGGLPDVPADSDFNDYKEFGAYSVAKNATAKTIANCPSDKAGTLRVWSANGRGVVTGDYVYILQEYVCYDNSGTYRRSLQLPDPNSSWEYGEWKLVADYVEGETGIWRWRKYSNGIAECWGRAKNTARDINTQFGSMYYGNCDEVTFPFSFYSAPVVNATVESGTALVLMSWQGTDGNGTATATKPASYRVMRPTTITGASFTVAYHAIGRWK